MKGDDMIAPGIPMTFVGLEWQLVLEAERRGARAADMAASGHRTHALPRSVCRISSRSRLGNAVVEVRQKVLSAWARLAHGEEQEVRP